MLYVSTGVVLVLRKGADGAHFLLNLNIPGRVGKVASPVPIHRPAQVRLSRCVRRACQSCLPLSLRSLSRLTQRFEVAGDPLHRHFARRPDDGDPVNQRDPCLRQRARDRPRAMVDRGPRHEQGEPRRGQASSTSSKSSNWCTRPGAQAQRNHPRPAQRE